MPKLDEKSKIVLLIPVTKNDYQKTLALLRNFARYSIEKFEPASLLLLFLYTPGQWAQYRDSVNVFKNIKARVKQMMKKYQGMKKSFFSWQSFSSLKLNNEIIDKAIHTQGE